MTLSRTEKERVLERIAALEVKRDAQTDPAKRLYYVLCLRGWEAHLRRL